jgi:hypothetical protein
MKRETRQYLAIGIIIITIVLLLVLKKDVMEGPAPSADPIVGCYVETLEKDVFTLNIRAENAGMVSGDLSFKNFEKDSSSGTFYGRYENGVLLADYEFMSEGVKSVREVAFKRVGADFVEGFGPVEVVDGREAFINIGDVTYDPKNTFIKSENCQLTVVVVKSLAYKNASYKLGFKYPETYYKKEKLDAGTPESPQLSVILAEDTPDNRAVLDGTTTETREGPTAITVDVYQNTDKLATKDWIGKDTNWTVANSVATRTTVAGLEALTFTWSGLYEGKTVIVTSGDKAYVLSVTWMNPDDQIKKDFETLLSTITLK